MSRHIHFSGWCVTIIGGVLLRVSYMLRGQAATSVIDFALGASMDACRMSFQTLSLRLVASTGSAFKPKLFCARQACELLSGRRFENRVGYYRVSSLYAEQFAIEEVGRTNFEQADLRGCLTVGQLYLPMMRCSPAMVVICLSRVRALIHLGKSLRIKALAQFFRNQSAFIRSDPRGKLHHHVGR